MCGERVDRLEIFLRWRHKTFNLSHACVCVYVLADDIEALKYLFISLFWVRK